jgi:hypothetical protein
MIEALVIAGLVIVASLATFGLVMASVYRIRYEDALEYLDEED